MDYLYSFDAAKKESDDHVFETKSDDNEVLGIKRSKNNELENWSDQEETVIEKSESRNFLKPGKLNRRLLAKVSKDLREKEVLKKDAKSLKFEDILENQHNSDLEPQSNFEEETFNKPMEEKMTSSSSFQSPSRSIETLSCVNYCSLLGNIMINSGLKWSENFKHVFTEDFKKHRKEI